MPNHWDLTCITMWDILSLIFWVILKGNCLLKTRSYQIMGIYMEKSNTLGDAKSYVSAIEMIVPEGFFLDTQRTTSDPWHLQRCPGVYMEVAKT